MQKHVKHYLQVVPMQALIAPNKRWPGTWVAKAVWPSCQRNSRVRMKGVGCLNSQRTTFVHWLSRSGRSRWLRIHCAVVCPGQPSEHSSFLRPGLVKLP